MEAKKVSCRIVSNAEVSNFDPSVCTQYQCSFGNLATDEQNVLSLQFHNASTLSLPSID